MTEPRDHYGAVVSDKALVAFRDVYNNGHPADITAVINAALSAAAPFIVAANQPEPALPRELPPRGPCAMCGSDDARHREVDAWVERVQAGDTEHDVADDHGVPVIAVQAAVVAHKSAQAALPEVACPKCGAWHRARMADRPDGDLRQLIAEVLCPPSHREGSFSMLTGPDGKTTSTVSPLRVCVLHMVQSRNISAVVESFVAAREAAARADEREQINAQALREIDAVGQAADPYGDNPDFLCLIERHRDCTASNCTCACHSLKEAGRG